jgi:hypothetical protein
MAELRSNLARLSQDVSRKRQTVSVFFVAGKREHLAAQSHKLYSILVVPPNHLDYISGIAQSKFLDELETALHAWLLSLVGAVLCRVLRLCRVLQRILVVKN